MMNMMNKKIFEQAQHYQTLGLNIVFIGNSLNIFNHNDSNLLKAPNHDWENYILEKQSPKFIESLEQQNMIGIGVILGYKNIYAIDIDGCDDFNFIINLCKILNIPRDYQWIFKSGSQTGYHILFQCDDVIRVNFTLRGYLANGSEFEEPFGNGDTNAYYPKLYQRNFCKIEFKWSGNIVLPNSLHISGYDYEFVNKIPISFPVLVSYERLLSLKNIYASLQASSSFIESFGDRGTFITQAVANKDEILAVYDNKRIKPYIIFTISKYRVVGVDAFYKEKLYIFQISWYVLDKNLNMIKRKIYNYYKSEKEECVSDGNIEYEKTKSIVVSNRYALMEFLFDLDHAISIVTLNVSYIETIKNEILNSGLYLDNFKQSKLTIKDSDFVFNDLLDKNIMYFEPCKDEIDILIHNIYKKLLKNNKITFERFEITDEIISKAISEAQQMISKAKMTPEDILINKEQEQKNRESSDDYYGYSSAEELARYEAFGGDDDSYDMHYLD